ncbi:hypothetical protein K0651_00875 [Ornithinimicrobium sp. Arc0846-15]|nr:hypothetical protein [Ornithinimicrobium laminariae]
MSVRELVAQLTDEETHVLMDGPGDPVIYPYLASLSSDEGARARLGAERSLQARGLLRFADGTRETNSATPDPHVIDTESGTAVVDSSLRPVVAVRRGALVVLVAHRTICRVGPTSPLGRELTRYLFVLDEVVVVEDVTAEGMHVLSIASLSHVDELLSEFLVPPGAAQGPEVEPVVVQQSLPPASVDASLHRPVLLAEVCLLTPWTVPESAIVALGSGGCYRSGEASRGHFNFEPMSSTAIVTQLADLLRSANDRQRREVSGLPGDQGTMSA